MLACGFRDETPKPGALIDLGTNSAGAISVMGMSWAATPSSTQPFIDITGFKGILAYVGNYIGSGYAENEGSFFVRISADGRSSRVLSAANEFTSLHSTNVANVWRDSSAPKAEAMLINTNLDGVKLLKGRLDAQVDQALVAPHVSGLTPESLAVRKAQISQRLVCGFEKHQTLRSARGISLKEIVRN